ncbi:MAG TPA: hydrogenase maturation nickel metallochaperone HypA [Thermoleophilaceae bacterium]
MHELSLSGAIVDTVVKHAAGRRVEVVNLTVGALRQVVPDSLEFYFEIVARGTVCEGARLEQALLAARAWCEGCEREWEVETLLFRCPRCGEPPAEIVSGNEFEVESIEVEEAACIAPR